jgi:(1->4)-alpha-D-glucan 1-alpha-D-glucosylmutase
VEAFLGQVIDFGWLNALSATTLKLTMPGVPDVYQGTELWSLALVDPDNRQLVDYDLRVDMLRSLEGRKAVDVFADMESGLPKLFVTHRLLWLRQQHPEWFDERGDYSPLWSSGSKSAHVIAYQRGGLVVVVPRLVAGLDGEWSDTTLGLPEGSWRNVFTEEFVRGGDVELATLLAGLPIGVLIAGEA